MNNGEVIQVANIVESKGGFGNPQRGRVYDAAGIAPTITTVTGGGLEPKIMQRARGFNNGGCHETAPTITGSAFQENNFVIQPCALRGRENGQMVEFNGSECANALTTVQKDSLIAEGWRIRKLTPRECFRLMGLTEVEIDTIQAAGISNSQQYKLAGNSIVVDVLAKIFEQLFRFNQLQ